MSIVAHVTMWIENIKFKIKIKFKLSMELYAFSESTKR